MPRIKLKSKTYARQDIEAWIRQEMKASRLTNDVMGTRLGYTGQRFSQKLKDMNFEYSELVILLDMLKCPPDKVVYFMTGQVVREVEL